MQPHRLSFPLDHHHVLENRDEAWLLAEPHVGLDVRSQLERAAQDVVPRGRVGLLKVGENVVRAETCERTTFL